MIAHTVCIDIHSLPQGELSLLQNANFHKWAQLYSNMSTESHSLRNLDLTLVSLLFHFFYHLFVQTYSEYVDSTMFLYVVELIPSS